MSPVLSARRLFAAFHFFSLFCPPMSILYVKVPLPSRPAFRPGKTCLSAFFPRRPDGFLPATGQPANLLPEGAGKKGFG
jgi:hypothetical protein